MTKKEQSRQELKEKLAAYYGIKPSSITYMRKYSDGIHIKWRGNKTEHVYRTQEERAKLLERKQKPKDKYTKKQLEYISERRKWIYNLGNMKKDKLDFSTIYNEAIEEAKMFDPEKNKAYDEYIFPTITQIGDESDEDFKTALKYMKSMNSMEMFKRGTRPAAYAETTRRVNKFLDNKNLSAINSLSKEERNILVDDLANIFLHSNEWQAMRRYLPSDQVLMLLYDVRIKNKKTEFDEKELVQRLDIVYQNWQDTDSSVPFNIFAFKQLTR